LSLIKQNKKVLALLFVFSFFVLLAWAFKTFYFVHELELSPHKKYILFSSGGFSLLIFSLLTFKKSKFNTIFAFFIYVFFTFLLYADAVYERYYDSILHIQLLGQADQLGDVKDSIISLIYKTDYWYWIDLPFILIACLFFNKKMKEVKRTLLSIILLISGTAVILFSSLVPLKSSFSDQYMVSVTGVIPAHIFDLSHSFYLNTFAKETSTQNNKQMNEIVKQFKENQELQKASPYFGKYKGKNVIIVQAESLNNFPIGLKVDGEEVTPHLNKLITESHYYPNTYLQIGRGNTSDAEFVSNNSIYPMAPKGIYKGFPNNDFLSLATVLNKQGYDTSATHGNSPEFWNRQQAYKHQGYTTFYNKSHPLIKDDEIIGLGISDKSIFSQMTDIYKKKEKPFYSFIVSLTSHRPFELPKKYQYMDLPGKFDDTPTGNYLQAVHYFDLALGSFIEELKAAGIWDDTIFVVYGDHYGPIPKDAEEIKNLLGINFDEKTRFNIPLIIHHPGETKGVINQVVASQMDTYPTITSLLGITQPLAQFGKPLDAKHEGFVGFAYETTRYTFYSDKYDFIASPNGSFDSGTCIDNETREKTDIEQCRKGYNNLVKDIDISKYLLDNNMIGNIFEKQ
jgi:lipoteichoic acid synthase